MTTKMAVHAMPTLSKLIAPWNGFFGPEHEMQSINLFNTGVKEKKKKRKSKRQETKCSMLHKMLHRYLIVQRNNVNVSITLDESAREHFANTCTLCEHLSSSSFGPHRHKEREREVMKAMKKYCPSFCECNLYGRK